MMQSHFQNIHHTTNLPNYIDYFDFESFWKDDIEPVIKSYPASRILDYDLEKYVAIKRKEYLHHAHAIGLFKQHNWYFRKGALPFEYDSTDWRCDEKLLPIYHKYVCIGAGHFLVNTMLYVAMTAYPNKDWRIVTSPEHSTIWDGEDTLFDLNYAGLSVPIEACINSTFLHDKSVMLAVGEYLDLGHNYYR